MVVPEVYSGFGSDAFNTDITETLYDKNIMSGPNWFYTLTGNGGGVDAEITKDAEWGRTNKGVNSNWYCLDLLNKYHTKSALKQFHALTFYFRNVQKPKTGAIITSMLPESFSYSIGGNWQSPVNLGGGTLADTFIKNLTNNSKSLSFSVDTSLVWQSPKRMDIIFKIPVLDDSGTGTHRNYQEAIELLSEAILPDVGEDGLYNSIPGPSIFTALTYKATEGVKTKGAETLSGITNAAGRQFVRHLYGKSGLWNRISIQVGSMLLLDWCIIKDLKVTFPNTKAQVLHDYRQRETDLSSLLNTEKSLQVVGETDTMTVFGTDRVLKDGNKSLEGDEYNYRVHLQPIQAELEITVSTVMGLTRATFKDMLYQNPSRFDNSGNNKKYQKGQGEEELNQIPEAKTTR